MLMFAREAKAKTEQVIDSATNGELIMVKEAIDEAISRGAFSTEIKGALHPAVKEKLIERGYDVEYGNQYNETWCTISWK